SASLLTSTPSSGSAPGLPQGCPFSIGMQLHRDGVGIVVVDTGTDHRRRRDHTAEALLDRLVRGMTGRRIRRSDAELPQEIDQLLHVADEVTTREVLVLEHTVERTTCA